MSDSIKQKHDFECIALGENGYHIWKCKPCGMTVRDPSTVQTSCPREAQEMSNYSRMEEALYQALGFRVATTTDEDMLAYAFRQGWRAATACLLQEIERGEELWQEIKRRYRARMEKP